MDFSKQLAQPKPVSKNSGTGNVSPVLLPPLSNPKFLYPGSNTSVEDRPLGMLEMREEDRKDLGQKACAQEKPPSRLILFLLNPWGKRRFGCASSLLP
jgi:hypothetical protein